VQLGDLLLDTRRQDDDTGDHDQVRVAEGVERHTRALAAADAPGGMLGLLVILGKVAPPEQLARQQRVEAALAAIQARFGVGAVRRGSELGEP